MTEPSPDANAPVPNEPASQRFEEVQPEAKERRKSEEQQFQNRINERIARLNREREEREAEERRRMSEQSRHDEQIAEDTGADLIRLQLQESQEQNALLQERLTILHQILKEMDENDDNARMLKLDLSGLSQEHLDAKGVHGATLLHLAATRGLVRTAETLIDLRANINARDDAENTPLHLACRQGHANVVSLLLNNDARTNLRDELGWSVLHGAAAKGHVKIVDHLLHKDKSTLNFTESMQGSTALHVAIVRDNTTVVERLLKEDELNVGIQDNAGRSALHLASLRGNEAILTMLLKTEAGQNLDIVNDRCMTPIQAAIDAGHFYGDSFSDDVMPDDSDAAVNENLGLQPGRFSAVVQLLLKRGATLNMTIETGRKVLRLAAKSHNQELMQSVVDMMDLEADEDPLAEHGSGGFSALLAWAAGDSKRHYAAKLLIIKAYKANSRSKPKDWGAIEWAVWAELPEELWLLIATSPQNKPTMDAIKRAKAWIDTGVEMKVRTKVQQKLKDIIEDPPIALPVMQMWKDRTTIDPPAFQKQKLFDKKHERGESQELGFLEDFKAVLTQFYKDPTQFASIRRDRAVRQVIYDEGRRTRLRAILSEARDDVRRYVRGLTDAYHGTGKPDTPIYVESEPRFTWVHLPFTNMIWMEDLLQRIMYDGSYKPQDFLQVKSFLRNSWVEVPDRESESRIMRPRFVMTHPEKHANSDENETGRKKNETIRKATDDDERAEGGIEGDTRNEAADLGKGGHDDPRDQMRVGRFPVPASAIYMPYLSYSMHHYKPMQADNEGERTLNVKKHSRVPNQDLRNQEEGLLRRHDADRTNYDRLLDCYSTHVIHGPSTLDEWYYHFPKDDPQAQKDRSHRNETQVVTEHLLGSPEGQISWPLVRVNQLWLWTLDKKWVITASPASATDGGNDLLLEGILNHLGTQKEAAGQPGSTDEMTKLIVDYCIGSYERRPSSQGQTLPKDLSIRQVFSNSINIVGRNETKLFEDFRSQSTEWRANLEKQAVGNSHEKQDRQNSAYEKNLRNSAKEAEELSAKIKDIRDELNILRAAVQYQRDVQEGMYWGQGGKEMVENGNDMRRILRADLSAEHIVNDIKEMDVVAERIQAAINTTLSLQQSEIANLQAHLSVEQGREAARQGRTLMIFTVVTILFLPLSFLSSLFALDVASFQQAPGWAFAVIFSVSVAFSVPFTIMALKSEEAAKLWKAILRHLLDFFGQFGRLWSSPNPPPPLKLDADIQAECVSDSPPSASPGGPRRDLFPGFRRSIKKDEETGVLSG